MRYGGDGKVLVFNYRERAALWDVPEWKERYRYTVTTAPAERDGRLRLTR